MVVVKRQKGESDDHLIARFRKKILFEGVLPEYRDKERYKKPAERRKEQKYKMAHIRELEKKRNV